jgi:hypothetical protein
VFQATVLEEPKGTGGIFYERPVDDIIAVDAAKRLHECVRINEGEKENGFDAMEIMRTRDQDQIRKLSQVHSLCVHPLCLIIH